MPGRSAPAIATAASFSVANRAQGPTDASHGQLLPSGGRSLQVVLGVAPAAASKLKTDLSKWSTRRPRRMPVSDLRFDSPRGRLATQGLILRLRVANGVTTQSVFGADGAPVQVSTRPPSGSATSPILEPWLTGCVPRVDNALRRRDLRLTRREDGTLISYAHRTRDRQQTVALTEFCVAGMTRVELTVTLSPADRNRAVRLAQAVIVGYGGHLALPLPTLGEPSRPPPAARPGTAAARALDARAAFALLGRAELCAMVRHEAGVAASSAQALHEMRLALRRLRSALTLFAAVLPPQDRDRFAEELRWVATRLARARDLEVFRALAAPSLDKTDRDRALRDGIAQACAQALDVARNHARRAIGSLRYRLLVLDLLRWFDSLDRTRAAHSPSCGKVSPTPDRLLRAQARRRLRRIIRDGRRLRTLDSAARHQLRIRAKKLRHCLEFARLLSASTRPQRTQRHLIRALRALQDALGELRDMERSRVIGMHFWMGLTPLERARYARSRLVRRWGYSGRLARRSLKRATASLRQLRRLS